jgi:CheY-like chemotaxis protein
MTHAVVLVVGKDPVLLETRSRVLRLAGFTVVPAPCPELAVVQFLQGDFDLVLLCHTIPQEERRRLCRSFHQHTPRTPIVSVACCSGQRDTFVDATVESGPAELIAGLNELVARNRVHFRFLAAPSAGNGGPLTPATKRSILWADDDAAVLDVGSQLLERAGYRVLSAQDGTEALRLFSSEAIDAVVLDYEMPRLNGSAVASRIREISRDVPMFLVSGGPDIPEVDLALFDGLIPEGDSFPVLLAALEKALTSPGN